MLGKFSCVADPAKPTLVMTQTFDAPRADVFEAWTTPEAVALWWDPTGAKLAVCEIDLRPGGAFCWINQSAAGAKHPFAGTYREIVPPERLVFEVRTSPASPPQLGTLIFTESENTNDADHDHRMPVGRAARRDACHAHRRRHCADAAKSRRLFGQEAELIEFPVTLATACMLGIAYAGLSVAVGRRRGLANVSLGLGSDVGVAIGEEYKAPPLLVAIRRHGQFAEYVPISILLLLLLELNHANTVALTGLAGVLVLSRLAWR